jgi:hypothetical protein
MGYSAMLQACRKATTHLIASRLVRPAATARPCRLGFNGSGFGSVNLDEFAHVKHRTRRFQLLTVTKPNYLNHKGFFGIATDFDRCQIGKNLLE